MITNSSDIRLGERGQMVLSIVHRYRLVTLTLLLLILPDSDAEALRVLLSRLVAAGWLRKFPLRARESYFTLGRRSLELLAAGNNKRNRPWNGFSHEGIIQHLSQGFFAARFGLIRLLEEEFIERFPGHHRPGLPSQSNFVQANGCDDTLCWAIVDHAQNASRLTAKPGEVVAKRFAVPAFRERILSGKFAIVILTALDSKRIQLEQAVQDRPRHMCP